MPPSLAELGCTNGRIRGLSDVLPRRRGVNGKRVHAALELRRERFVHHAVALDSALPSEGVRHNMNPEMSFAAFPMAGVSGVLVGLVDHVEARRREGARKLLQDGVAGIHGWRLSRERGSRSMWLFIAAAQDIFRFVKT